MDVFQLRDQLIADCEAYVTSFMALRDDRIRERVETSLKEGRLWPEPRIGLNPAFESGGAVDALVDEGLLHEGCRSVFRIGKSEVNPLGSEMRLHRHQVDAIREAQLGRNYVLTTGTGTGTGSGKSLSYIVPIVDHVLREGSGRSIKAIVVYPMNALANSQFEELRKFLGFGPGQPPVKVARYTGQESMDEREAVRHDPPDVLLTNYVMLELILTRLRDQHIVRHAQDLRFLVLDELHTYRGRQGADVALLVRRVRDACNATHLQCVGTSATLPTEGTHDSTRRRRIRRSLIPSRPGPSGRGSSEREGRSACERGRGFATTLSWSARWWTQPGRRRLTHCWAQPHSTSPRTSRKLSQSCGR